MMSNNLLSIELGGLASSQGDYRAKTELMCLVLSRNTLASRTGGGMRLFRSTTQYI